MNFENIVEKIGFAETVGLFWQARRLPKDFWSNLSFHQAKEIRERFAADQPHALARRAFKVMEARAQSVWEWSEVHDLLPKKDLGRRRVIIKKMFAVVEGATEGKFGLWKELYHCCVKNRLKAQTKKCLEGMSQCAKSLDEWENLRYFAGQNKDQALAEMSLNKIYGFCSRPANPHDFYRVKQLEDFYSRARSHPRLQEKAKRRIRGFASHLGGKAHTKESLIELLTTALSTRNFGGMGTAHPILGPLLRVMVCRKIVKTFHSFEELDGFISNNIPTGEGSSWVTPHVWMHEDASSLLKKMSRVAHSLEQCLSLRAILHNKKVKIQRRDRVQLIGKVERRIRTLAHSFDQWRKVANGWHLSPSLCRHARKRLVAIIKQEVPV